MTSKLAVYNNVLVHLGERRLASLTEAREPRRVLDDVWTQEITFCLQAGQWNFATRSAEFASSTSVVPTFGYAYAFTKPDDWLRTIGFSAGETFDTPLDRYRDEAGYWYADVDPLYVRYVSNHTAYGFDLSLWPAAFDRFVGLHIAEKICKRVTGSDPDDGLKRNLKAAKKQALSLDAMDDPAPSMPQGSWVSSRMGHSRYRIKMNLP